MWIDCMADLQGGRAGSPLPLGRRTDAVMVLLISENGTVLWRMLNFDHSSVKHVIRQLRCIRFYLDFKTANTIATSIVHSKLDYCNSLYFNLPDK